ncbi:MAG: thiamine phosphate synthase [Thermocladium sp.]|jgi:thiamine-phosphate pyrophosphorylase|nr:MAG: thiamine-phosphate synthase [Thermocladium sp. ECH_B]
MVRLPKGLYGITDTSYRARSHVEAARIFLEGGSRIIQYRRKSGSIREMMEEAKAVGRLCREYGAVFIVDDRVDVAILSDADGVHVGVEDAPVAEVRKRFGGLIIGASASSISEAMQGEAGGADYLGVGSVFPSPTKPDYEVLGIDGLRRIIQAIHVPAYAIGGITLDKVPLIKEAGAWGVAVISAVLDAEDPVKAAKAFTEAWDE